MTSLLGNGGCRSVQREHDRAGGEPSVVATSLALPPRVIERSGYMLTHPADWKVDEKAASFDLDHFFSIDGPGSCHVIVEFFPPTLGEKDCLDTQNAAFKGMFKEPPSESSFSSWGAISGTGTELRGKMKPLGAGRVRNFAHSDERRTLFINEFCFDDSLSAAQPGFELIARTFRLR
jgi:hypothetical protein